MIVEQIYTENAYRNFNYLIACSESGEALAIDPLESDLCLRTAKEKGWEITQILTSACSRTPINQPWCAAIPCSTRAPATAMAVDTRPSSIRHLLANSPNSRTKR